MAITTVGLDIAKSVFQVHGVDAHGIVLVRRQLKRRYVLAFFKKLPPCLVGIEACATSHHWSRELQALGHNVRLIQWLAFVIAGFWGGIAGVAFLYYHGFISPHAMGLPSSAEALLMVIAGGAGTLAGPVVGAFIVVVLKTVVSAYVTRWMTLLGVTFILIVVFLPEGMVPGLDKLRRRLRLSA